MGKLGTIIATLVLAIMAIAYARWRCLYRAKPNCAAIRNPYTRDACYAGTNACNQYCGDARKSCLNAVKHCLPAYEFMDRASSGLSGGLDLDVGRFFAKATPCVRALQYVDPRIFVGA